MNVSVPVCGNMHANASAMEARTTGSQSGFTGSYMSCLMWELRIELRSSGKAIHMLSTEPSLHPCEGGFIKFVLPIPTKSVGIGASAYTSPVVVAGRNRIDAIRVLCAEAAWQLPAVRQVWVGICEHVGLPLILRPLIFDRQASAAVGVPFWKSLSKILRCYSLQGRPPNFSIWVLSR